MPDASPPQPKSTRYHSLDLWRGIACLMIVVSHGIKTITDEQWAAGIKSPLAWFLFKIAANLYIGVPLFFVISGYCIAATAESTLRKGGSVGVYFQRRLRRIFPPYWVIFGISLVLVSAVAALGHGALFTEGDNQIPHPRELSILQWIGSVSLTEIWRHHLTGGESHLFFGPSWTLCYEEQFYAVCGLIMFLAPRRLWASLTLVSVATLVAGTAAELFHLPLGGFFFDGRWLIFASGLLVYYHVNHASPGARRALFAGLAVAVVLGLGVRYGLLQRTGTKEQKLLAFEIVIGGIFGLALILLHASDRTIARLSILRPLQFCGEMCYSLYLVHWPVTVFLTHLLDGLGVKGIWPVWAITVPVSLVASIVAARIFYHLVEKRFLNAPVADAAPAGAAA
jgi:peptidoglycan/LPS O-acetylase OafA/YrhL